MTFTASPWREYGYDRDHFALTRTTEPTTSPVSMSEVQAYLKVEEPEENALINGLILAATSHVENYCQRSLITQTWRFKMDDLPRDGVLTLPRPNLISVASITYVDTDGTTQTLASDQYTVDTASEPGRVVEAYSATWPYARCQPGSVTVTYTAGYGAASSVPQAIKQAILMLCAHWYEQRQIIAFATPNELPEAWKALVSPYCVGWEQ